MTADEIRRGLEQLGVKRMLLAIHDVSFPSDPDEDIGRGSPATRAAGRLFAYARKLGFTGVQLGPQGQTSRVNPSPYDGTIFSRHIGNISATRWRELVDERYVEQALVTGGGPAQHRHAHDASRRLLNAAYLLRSAELGERTLAFGKREYRWLTGDALHSAICSARGDAGYRDWPEHDRDLWIGPDYVRIGELVNQHVHAMERYVFGQLLVHDELARVRASCGLALYGDLQVGYSDADRWRYADVFLPGYLMGAPPSRTNTGGQPWGYPVLDPAGYSGPAFDLVVARAEKAFAEYDSLRIDHPHGLVCPWVYRSDADVAHGARLFESPDLPDHPALAMFAIARADQIDRTKPRYHDAWVTQLDDDQIARYAILIDAIVAAAERAGRARADLSMEVLSTMPAPLGYVLARHGFGRWRVTQKASMDDPTDVYRTENAQPADWVMLGNHDTPPILSVIRGWSPALREQWARHLAARLRLERPQRLASDGFCASAMLAELFVSRAENVSIFFADLFGITERFNMPGVVDEANWTLRLPHDFERMHEDNLAHEAALDIPLAISLALAAR